MAQTLSSKGISDSWQKSQATVRKIFDIFRNSSEELQKLYPNPFNQLPENVLCKRDVYGQLFHFLVHTYRSQNKNRKKEDDKDKRKVATAAVADVLGASGSSSAQAISSGGMVGAGGVQEDEDRLEGSTVLNYVSNLINQAKDRFLATTTLPETKLFFTCLDPGSKTEHAQWFAGLKRNAWRLTAKRTKEKGGVVDKSETPLYLHHVQLMNRAYAQEGSAESAKRSFAVTCLWSGAVRSGEVGCLCWESMVWDSLNLCVFVEWFQHKTSKAKTVAFLAGANRDICWFLRLADYLVLQGDQRQIFESGSIAWVFQDMQMRKSPGTCSLL
jgi:hypothetical protein